MSEITGIENITEGWFVSGPDITYWAPDWKSADAILTAWLRESRSDGCEYTFTDMANVRVISLEQTK